MINTDSYLLIGLVVVAIVLFGYVGSIGLRLRSARATLQTIEAIRDEA